VKRSIRVLDYDAVVRICVDNDCDQQRVQIALDKYNTKEKYQGLKQFEWQTTETRQDLQEKRRKKQ